MTDKILLHNMIFYGYHGAYEHEQQHGQRFHLDVELKCDLTKPSQSDDLSDAIDYTRVYADIKHAVENLRFNLLEALAGRIANTLLQHYPITQVTVRIRKPACPLPGALDYAQVEIIREVIQ
jgi:dihydroneopterin aldolase